MNNLKKAELIAATAHKAIGQKRKYTNEEYINHPFEVVYILKNAGVTDKDTLAAAWLHDVVEDTGITLDFIEFETNKDIADIVEMVTDISKPEDGNRAERKRIDREHYKTADHKGKTVKLADIISNSRSIEKHDKNFAVTYFKEMKMLLPYLKGGNVNLFYKASEIIGNYYLAVENERLQEALKC